METRIQNNIFINAPIEEVFDFVTTIGNWPQWVPDTIEVFGQTDRPARQRDEVTENVKTLGLVNGDVSWRITKCERPNHWSMESTSINLPLLRPLGTKDFRIIVSYVFSSKNSGTDFGRTFSYNSPTLIFRIVNWLFIRRQMKTLANRMFKNLKHLFDNK